MKFAILQHSQIENAGFLNLLMRENGIDYDTYALDKNNLFPELDNYNALIILGGPMDPLDHIKYPWLKLEIALIREAIVERKLPTLGICLGHQLMAVALGGSVSRMHEAEVGVSQVSLNLAGTRDPLFRGWDDITSVVQWHDWQIATPPTQALILANSPDCNVQAMRLCNRAWGIQFHLEIHDKTINQWLTLPEYVTELKDLLGENACKILRDQFDSSMTKLNADARILFTNFIRLASLEPYSLEE